MNLTGRPPYQKGSAKKKSKKPTAEQIRYREEKVRPLGCILNHMGIAHDCYGRTTIHHCGTGGGSRKDHDQVVPLCENMHTGPHGIDGRRSFSKRGWQEAFATEEAMLEAVNQLLNSTGGNNAA